MKQRPCLGLCIDLLKNTLSTIVRFWVRDLYRYISSLRAIFTSGIRVVYVPGPTHSSSTLLPTFFPFWGLLKLFGIRTVVGIRGPFFAFCSSPNLSDKIFRKIFYLDDVTQQIIADKIIYVDPYLRTYIQILKKGILIPNSVDTQKFCPNPSTETNTVTYVGRLSQNEGYGYS
jgi:glycosyltransferase involved in cell wall biosynthesis